MYTGEFPKRMGREGGGLGYPNTHYVNFGSCHVTFHLTFFSFRTDQVIAALYQKCDQGSESSVHWVPVE